MTKEKNASPYRLSEEQVKEVERRRADFTTGKERNATDEELAALWEKCGLLTPPFQG
jgi:hypothetical protein